MDGNEQVFMKFLKLYKKKSVKTSAFCLSSLIGISVLCADFYMDLVFLSLFKFLQH